MSMALSLTVSCTTGESDSADGFEDEASTEDMEGAEDATAAAEETDEATEEADEADESSQAKKEESKESDEDSEDDEFLAEDSTSPAAPPKENLEEKDLQNELEKEKVADAADPATPTLEESAPPAAPVAAGTVTPNEIEDPMIEEEMAQPNSAAVAAASSSKADTVTADGFEVINPPVPQEDLGVSDPLVAEVDPPLPSLKAAQEIVPLSKMSKDPFFRNERLMNTVYIVRPNDDLAIISQKIFNEDKTSILFADNPHLSKGIETGDKIYYNSPNRPEDKKAILTFYEDNKMSPQYYVTRKGDDIKKIGREVLGNEEGWKEIWSTNEALQTQALLPAGLKIRYWSGSEPKAYEEPAVANNESTAAVGATETPSPPPAETLTEMPPPSPEPATIATEDPGMSQAPLPTESLSAMPSTDLPSVKAPEEGSDLMTVAAIAMIAMAGLGIVAIQIKNRKRDDGGMPPSLEFTKV